MRPLERRAAESLNIADALNSEASARNSVLPPQPGLAQIAERESGRFAEWLKSELASGMRVSPQVVVNARKPRHGTRPAPIMGIPERVAYRAIVDRMLLREDPLQRDPVDYLSFVQAPVNYVMDKAGGLRTVALLLDDDEIRYVVKSDLAAFYQYVDHGILARLLVSRSRDLELVEVTAELLADLEGRSFGLPQMFDPSDRLSEIYAQLLQDQLLRRGHLVWRFNDDFRIGAASFVAALDAIEALSEEARSLGLIINEQKTTSPRFANYVMATFGLSSIDDEIPLDEQGEVESAVADYLEEFGDPDEAVFLIRAALSDADKDWDLGNLDRDDVGRLRRAIWSVARAEDDRIVDAIVPLAIYVPSLTPVLCRYAEVIAAQDLTVMAASIDAVVSTVSLGGWQRMWFCHLLRSSGLLADADGDAARRMRFVTDCATDGRHPVVRAEAALALAGCGQVSVASLAAALTTEPKALASWYVVAAATAVEGSRDERVIEGLRGSDSLYALLIDSVQ